MRYHQFLAALVAAAFVGPVAAQIPDPPPLPSKEAAALIASVRSSWRSLDGETADVILAKVAGVAHFVPRGWEAGNDGQGGRYVAFDFVRRPTETASQTMTVSFTIDRDGEGRVATPDDGTFNLGWQAYALSLIQGEVNEEAPDANKRFLLDPANLDFVRTPQGPLGDLLAKGGCTLEAPVQVEYTSSWGREHPAKGDFWRVQVTVNCAAPGPSYFTKGGIVIFLKTGVGPWKQWSFLANRIAINPPGHWFTQDDPEEQAAMAVVAEKGKDAGWSTDDEAAALKSMELLNDGSIVHW